MSATLISATAGASIIATETITDGAATGPETAQHNAGQSYGVGTANGQAQHVVTNIITVNTTGTTLDLTALAGGDGSNRNFSSIVEFMIENLDTTNGALVSGGASNPWAGLGVTVNTPLEAATLGPPATAGGRIQRGSPNTGLVVTGTSKTILLQSAAATASVRYTFLGRGT